MTKMASNYNNHSSTDNCTATHAHVAWQHNRQAGNTTGRLATQQAGWQQARNGISMKDVNLHDFLPEYRIHKTTHQSCAPRLLLQVKLPNH